MGSMAPFIVEPVQFDEQAYFGFPEPIRIHLAEYYEPQKLIRHQGPVYGPRRKRGKGNKYHDHH